MNKMSCNVIQDLMPLYIENMCSAESRELVEAHIAECEKCRQLFSDYTDDTIVKEVRQPEKEEQAFQQILHKVENKIMKRVTVIATAVISFIIAIGIISFAPLFHASYEDAGLNVIVSEINDTVYIDTSMVRLKCDVDENTIVLNGKYSLVEKQSNKKSGQTYRYSESLKNGKINKVIFRNPDESETVLWER
ncbi:zf-HC2 domain-containing protein [uncultured Eubacterium sp.]|uniref:zf-HC2 domain-containing protein n=1 Tax=uncultured Eubacterium sp. TaxID=165185 RepID=UPI0025E93E5F|nr:zf-HC2 domain-containing protein [uncultured Eubacterium sp.]